MKYATLCSGIGAPEVAFDRFGWECAYKSEIEPFPCAVLSHHWPHVPNYGDMTRWREWPNHNIDLVIAGTPCQAFSVAGMRKSLNDQRGNLTLEFAKYCNTTRPRFVLWENVPGVLNTKDNAFGCFLGAIAGSDNALVPTTGRWTNAGLVSGPLRQIAWRILDAQYFGVPQRRRRVFVLAGDTERGAGDWACARALFPVCESLRGDIEKSEETRKEVAGTLGGGSGNRGWQSNLDTSGAFVVSPLTTTPHADNASEESKLIVGLSRMTAFGEYVDDGTASTCKQRDYKDATDLVDVVHWTQGGGEVCDGVSGALRSGAEHNYQFLKDRSSVRRLTPRECERLQGFPDDHTLVEYRGKPASDGPRYKAIGNSMAVPVLEWIGRNLQEIL